MFCVFVNDVRDELTQPEVKWRLPTYLRVCSKIGTKGLARKSSFECECSLQRLVGIKWLMNS